MHMQSTDIIMNLCMQEKAMQVLNNGREAK